LSFKFTAEDIRLFAKITNTELVMIDDKTDINSFERQLELLDATAALKR
jgi:L-arabinose isomerase